MSCIVEELQVVIRISEEIYANHWRIRTVSNHFDIDIVFRRRVFEPIVIQDFSRALLTTANSFIRLYLQESVDKVFKLIGMRYPNLIGYLVLLSHAMMLYATSLVDPNEHLVHDDADGPPVSCEGKILAFKELWSDAAWNSCISIVVKCRVDRGQLLSQAKVYDLEIASLVEEQILQFEVTVYD